jgi:hypothetical protein
MPIVDFVHQPLHQPGWRPGADAGSLLAVGQSVVTLHHWTFLLGPGFVVGIGNGLILGYPMYRSGLVPRGMALLGLIAGPVLLARSRAGGSTFGPSYCPYAP